MPAVPLPSVTHSPLAMYLSSTTSTFATQQKKTLFTIINIKPPQPQKDISLPNNPFLRVSPQTPRISTPQKMFGSNAVKALLRAVENGATNSWSSLASGWLRCWRGWKYDQPPSYTGRNMNINIDG